MRANRTSFSCRGSWAGEDLPLGYGRPLLIDFGSARPAEVVIDSRREALAEQDRAAEFCTANYRAPELWDVPSHCVLDGRIDVWFASHD